MNTSIPTHAPDNGDAAALAQGLVQMPLVLLAAPGIVITLMRRATAPVTVCVRHELGERFYRLGGFVRLFTYFALALPSALPLMYGAVFGPICFLAGWAVNWTVLWWFWRCDREIRREIAARRRSGAVVHSWSAGVPRFGLPNDELTNLVVLPAAVFVAGAAVSPVSFGVGCYLCFAGISMRVEGGFRRRLAREAELDALDRLHETAGDRPAREASQCVPAAENVPPGANPLAGFQDILSAP